MTLGAVRLKDRADIIGVVELAILRRTGRGTQRAEYKHSDDHDRRRNL